jgi:hypothetical protein
MKHLSNIDSDMYISIIDKPSSIKLAQKKTGMAKYQNHDLYDLLIWQAHEMMQTKYLAGDKPMYVFSNKQHPSIIDAMIYSNFLIYFQMAITDANKKEREEISNIKDQMDQVAQKNYGWHTPIIDPRDIDIDSGKGITKKEEQAFRMHTVYRDEKIFIAQATGLVAYHTKPKNPKKMLWSVGVSDESKEGSESGKDVFNVMPGRDFYSPFLDRATENFSSLKDFFKFFPDYVRERTEALKRQ